MSNPINFTVGNENIPGSPIGVSFAIRGRNTLWRGVAQPGYINAPSVSAGTGLRMDAVGSWQTHTANFDNGVELIIEATSGPIGIRRASAKIIRIDERAPYQRVFINTAQHGKSTLQSAGIEGRFHILDPEQYGVINPNSMLAVKLAETGVRWNLEVMHPGAILPDIVNKTMVVDGETLSVAVAKRRRALRL